MARFGIPSNPGFTDYNIVSGLRRATCLEPVEPWDEFDATSGKIFHDHLAVTLEELGIEVDKESLPVDMGLNLIPQRFDIMSEIPITKRAHPFSGYSMLIKELVREVKDGSPTSEKYPFYVERKLDSNQYDLYPRLFMGIESEDEVYQTSISGLDHPLHGIGHINEIHLQDDGVPSIGYTLTLEGLVIVDYPYEHIIDEVQVGLLAKKLAASN